jgi:hypothetical protein
LRFTETLYQVLSEYVGAADTAGSLLLYSIYIQCATETKPNTPSVEIRMNTQRAYLDRKVQTCLEETETSLLILISIQSP